VTEPVSDQALIDALGGQLDGEEITGMRRRPYRYATSAPLEEVVVLAGGEERRRLILKDLSRDRLLGDAPAAKPQFVYEPQREVETYRRILAPAGIGPRCWAAAVEPTESRGWLLLEKVPGVELWQVGEIEVWNDVARWLGGFHARFAGDLDGLRAVNPHLLEHTATWFRFWCERASEAIATSAEQRARELFAALERYGEVVAPLAELPRTLLHGELYPSNVLVVRGDRPAGVYPVDWEMAAIGPGLLDLAALVGGWAPRERESLAKAYLDGRGLRSASTRDLDELTTGLSRCRLHLALQWLGWSADWRPPPEHAHDWLAEALELTQELGLA
jgi:aminoglycoside phosphotransferase (APT) family kinase protein